MVYDKKAIYKWRVQNKGRYNLYLKRYRAKKKLDQYIKPKVITKNDKNPLY